MELNIAEHNFDLLSNLQPYQKLTVEISSGKMEIDNRWFQGLIRRKLTGDSRNDIVDPIQSTFKKLTESKKTEEMKICLDNIRDVFSTTYPTFEQLHMAIKDIYISLKIDNEECKYNNNPYIIDISKIQKQKPTDFVCVIPSSFHSWDDALKNKLLTNSNSNYSRIAPKRTDKDAVCIKIGDNREFLDTTTKLGQVKYMDFEDCTKTLKDGAYDIRYCGQKEILLTVINIKDGKLVE